VRAGLEVALSRNIPVIPVLVDGTTMPKVYALPDSLREFAYLQFIEISRRRFEFDVETLIEALADSQKEPSTLRLAPLSIAELEELVVAYPKLSSRGEDIASVSSPHVEEIERVGEGTEHSDGDISHRARFEETIHSRAPSTGPPSRNTVRSLMWALAGGTLLAAAVFTLGDPFWKHILSLFGLKLGAGPMPGSAGVEFADPIEDAVECSVFGPSGAAPGKTILIQALHLPDQSDRASFMANAMTLQHPSGARTPSGRSLGAEPEWISRLRSMA
jgi:hypothetical protein